MSVLTPIFNLFKLQKADKYAISQFNSNMDIIDEEMAKPPLTVNQIEPDPTTRNLELETVPLADNLSSDEAQINMGTYILRTSGGEASISDGPAWLSDLKGNQIKTGYVPESLTMTVTPAAREEGDMSTITATIDRDTFVAYVSTSGTITLTYTTDWSADPELYGITVTGEPISGDQIVVVYVKEVRGTITVANPTGFISTGWNLYNHATGYAMVPNYSEEYGFMIDGTYTKLEFSTSLTGERTEIEPVDGYFTVNADGYVFVTGGNDTDTAIWMTWSDWTEEANGGVFEAYSQTVIDLSGVMVNFPFGLARIGNVFDEIDLNTLRAYSRIERMLYTEENLAQVIASGVPYDTDTSYIYAVRILPQTYSISLDGEYTVSDHGTELFTGTSVPVQASSLYGNDLKGKLRRDVLTISQQSLTAAHKAQVKSNLGFATQEAVDTLNDKLTKNPVYDSSFTEATAAQLNASGSRTIETKIFPSGDSVYLVIAYFDASAILGGVRTNVSIGNGTNIVTVYEGTPLTSNFFGGNGSFLAKGGDTVSCILYTGEANALSSFRCRMYYVQLR